MAILSKFIDPYVQRFAKKTSQGITGLFDIAGKGLQQSTPGQIVSNWNKPSLPVQPSSSKKSYPATPQLSDYLGMKPFQVPTTPKITASPFSTIGGQTGPWAPPTPVKTSAVASTPLQENTKVLSDTSVASTISPIKTPSPTPVTPPSPAVNQALVDAEKAQSSAQKVYQESLKLTPDELATQEDLDRNLESIKQGFTNTKNQAIPMEFITGQLKNMEERALLKTEPLEKKLARMQAARLASVDASKFALDRADKKLTEIKGGPSTKEVSAGSSLTKWNPETGKYETAYTAPEKPSAATKDEGFTLGEGQTRYDSFGNPIAIAPQKSSVDESKEEVKRVETATDAVSVIQRMFANSKGLNEAIGNIQGRIPGVFKSNEARAFDQDFQTLTGLLTLENMGIMKGVLSDSDIKILKDASRSLNTTLEEGEFKKRLQEIMDKLGKVVSSEGKTASGGGGVVQTLAGPVSTDW